MCAFRCLASLLLLVPVVKAARPGLEILRQEALVAKSNFWKDPCAELGAKRKRKLSRIFKKGTLCQCQEDFFTNVQCDRPLVKDFILRETPSKCRCEENPCKKFHAKMLNGYEQCKCHKGLSTSNHCEKPLAKLFSLSARMPAECRCDQTDPCEKFGAEAAGADRATGEVLCLCPEKFAAVASTKCSRPGQRVFSAVGNVLGCHCKQAGIYAKSVKSPVETAALAFCEAAAKMKEPLPSKVPPASKCKQQLSHGTTNGGFGRLAVLLQQAPKTAAWHLTRVCHDECEELVNETKEQLKWILRDITPGARPVGETCAARVVKKVEAEVFGCCGRSCGWNGRGCISWPFFDEQQKADWLAECCTEYNVLKNSSREEMCNSVLSTHDADLASKNDLSQEGKDVAAAYLGQDFQLLWTQKGVDSEMGRNYTWLQPKPEAGKEVTDQLLQLQPNIRKKALNEGWFKEKKMESASLMQMRDTGASCDPKVMETCTGDMQKWRTRACAKQQGWQYTHVKKTCRMMTKNKRMAKSPYECLEKTQYGDVGTIRHFLFQYKKVDLSDAAAGQHPIWCYAAAEKTPCNQKPRSLQQAQEMEFDRIWFWIDASSAADAKTAFGNV
ncbi:Uncharacterized protein SCF082_LOCUS33518 [Durusdinium trenchii]